MRVDNYVLISPKLQCKQHYTVLSLYSTRRQWSQHCNVEIDTGSSLKFDRSIMSYFRKFKHFSNVLIRIPPLFVIDSVLNGTLLKIVYQSVHPDYSVFPITTWAQLFQWLATSFTSQYLYILFCCCLRCPC